MTRTERTDHFYDLLAEFDTAMLVTRARDGQLRARPMAMAEQQRDGDLWFATKIDSAKVNEIQMDPQVNVSLQSDDKYLSISGRAIVVRDRAKIDELWDEAWKVWFPEGKDDPELALLRVEADEGEYWDNQGTNKLEFLFEAAKAYVKGEEMDDTDNSQKVNL